MKIMKYFFLSVLAILTVYAAFAVGNWETYIGNWDSSARVMFAFIEFVIFCVINIAPNIKA